MGASIKPVPLICFILGCFNKERNSFSFSATASISSSSLSVRKVARAAEAIIALPPKVVMCPNFGFSVK